ncbi:unnamed protein product [Prorocentrum cordatum]|uniref:Uncharacterized protein n=1 Tax=Prorocentrum cordatum TaxID=2364126 RepID=A0ABN9SQ71_9DINO|nr:unnamed protein product [Polarella glacialis]
MDLNHGRLFRLLKLVQRNPGTVPPKELFARWNDFCDARAPQDSGRPVRDPKHLGRDLILAFLQELPRNFWVFLTKKIQAQGRERGLNDTWTEFCDAHAPRLPQNETKAIRDPRNLEPRFLITFIAFVLEKDEDGGVAAIIDDFQFDFTLEERPARAPAAEAPRRGAAGGGGGHVIGRDPPLAAGRGAEAGKARHARAHGSLHRLLKLAPPLAARAMPSGSMRLSSMSRTSVKPTSLSFGTATMLVRRSNEKASLTRGNVLVGLLRWLSCDLLAAAATVFHDHRVLGRHCLLNCSLRDVFHSVLEEGLRLGLQKLLLLLLFGSPVFFERVPLAGFSFLHFQHGAHDGCVRDRGLASAHAPDGRSLAAVLQPSVLSGCASRKASPSNTRKGLGRTQLFSSSAAAGLATKPRWSMAAERCGQCTAKTWPKDDRKPPKSATSKVTEEASGRAASAFTDSNCQIDAPMTAGKAARMHTLILRQFFNLYTAGSTRRKHREQHPARVKSMSLVIRICLLARADSGGERVTKRTPLRLVGHGGARVPREGNEPTPASDARLGSLLPMVFNRWNDFCERTSPLPSERDLGFQPQNPRPIRDPKLLPKENIRRFLGHELPRGFWVSLVKKIQGEKSQEFGKVWEAFCDHNAPRLSQGKGSAAVRACRAAASPAMPRESAQCGGRRGQPRRMSPEGPAAAAGGTGRPAARRVSFDPALCCPHLESDLESDTTQVPDVLSPSLLSSLGSPGRELQAPGPPPQADPTDSPWSAGARPLGRCHASGGGELAEAGPVAPAGPAPAPGEAAPQRAPEPGPGASGARPAAGGEGAAHRGTAGAVDPGRGPRGSAGAGGGPEVEQRHRPATTSGPWFTKGSLEGAKLFALRASRSSLLLPLLLVLLFSPFGGAARGREVIRASRSAKREARSWEP